VTSELHGDFGIRRAGEFRLVFVRSIEGDTEELDVEAGSNEHKLHIKVRLIIYPD
jgi:hypothetical protein